MSDVKIGALVYDVFGTMRSSEIFGTPGYVIEPISQTLSNANYMLPHIVIYHDDVLVLGREPLEVYVANNESSLFAEWCQGPISKVLSVDAFIASVQAKNAGAITLELAAEVEAWEQGLLLR